MGANLQLVLVLLVIFLGRSTGDNIYCGKLEVPLSKLMNNTLNLQHIPSDFKDLAGKFNESNATVIVQNCSYMLISYNHSFIRYEVNVQDYYYAGLHNHIMVESDRYGVETQSDAIFSMNSFSSTNLDSKYKDDLYIFFIRNRKWLPMLMSNNFRFDKSAWSETLMLRMMCTLINGFDFKYGLPFLFHDTHSCFFKNNNKRARRLTFIKPTYEMFMDNIYNASNTSFLENIRFNKTVESSNTIIHNHTILENILKNITFGNNWNRFNIALNLSSNTIVVTNESKPVVNEKNKNRIPNTLESVNEELTVVPEISTEPYGTDKVYKHSHKKSEAVFDEKENNIRAANLEEVDMLQKSLGPDGWYMDNLNIKDVVEMTGPCTEGQQHVVKFDVQSLLTAIDKNAPKESVALFQKLVPTVKSFPIEEYNVRGDIVRDLLIAISNQESDPIIKQKIEEVLGYVILTGPGILPPRIKLQCEDILEQDGEPEKIQRGEDTTFFVEYIV